MEEIMECFNNYVTDVGEKLKKTIKKTKSIIFYFWGVKREIYSQFYLLRYFYNVQPHSVDKVHIIYILDNIMEL